MMGITPTVVQIFSGIIASMLIRQGEVLSQAILKANKVITGMTVLRQELPDQKKIMVVFRDSALKST